MNLYLVRPGVGRLIDLDERIVASRHRIATQVLRVRAARAGGGDVAIAWRVLRFLRRRYSDLIVIKRHLVYDVGALRYAVV